MTTIEEGDLNENSNVRRRTNSS